MIWLVPPKTSRILIEKNPTSPFMSIRDVENDITKSIKYEESKFSKPIDNLWFHRFLFDLSTNRHLKSANDFRYTFLFKTVDAFRHAHRDIFPFRFSNLSFDSAIITQMYTTHYMYIYTPPPPVFFPINLIFFW